MASYNAHVRVDAIPGKFEDVITPLQRKSTGLNTVNITEIGTKILYKERQWDNLDPFEYKYDKTDPGYVMIINQINFLNEDPKKVAKLIRHGSEIDVLEIIKCFGRQGYNIGQQNIVIDKTKNELLNEINRVCDNELANTNSLIVFVMTHGTTGNQLCVNDGTIEIQEIIQPFLEVNSFRNKPKTFIFQACKVNEEENKKRDYERDYKLYVNSSLTSEPNTLMCFSTLEDDYSYRLEKQGTWFIQELCRNIYSYGHREEILSILMRCNKCLARNYFNHDDITQNIKQTPLFISTLTRNFYVSRNKDRYYYIKKMNDLRQIQDATYDLMKTLYNRKIYY